MIDKNFYKNKGPFPLSYLISQLDLDYTGDKEFVISDIAPLDSAGPNEITFFHDKKYENEFKKTRAGAIIIDKKLFSKSDLNRNYILSDSPYFTMAHVASIFYPNSDYPNFFYNEDERMKNIDSRNNITSNSFIHKDSFIGKNCVIGSFVKIGPGVKIGDNCVIGDNVNIYFSLISDNVKIYNGAKIGGEGFGFVPGKNAIKKVPQLGRVIIKKNSEIGCNATIDRGSIGDTIISENVMIDNLVHIAHNVKIGKNTIIAAMTGISGSVQIGDYVMIGGQVGISGHLKIGNNVKIAAKSGIMKNIDDNMSVGGYPAVSIIDWHRSTINRKKRK